MADLVQRNVTKSVTCTGATAPDRIAKMAVPVFTSRQLLEVLGLSYHQANRLHRG